MMAKSRADQRGFTLLELLVVMFILVTLVGLVSPYVTVGSDDDMLKTESQTLRFALQDVVDQSWITASSFVVVRDQESLAIWQEKADGWEKVRTLYSLPNPLSLQLMTDSDEVESALDALQFNKNGVLVFLSSGEYLPFTLALFSTASSANDIANNTVKVSGDGINDIFIE